MTFTHFSDPLQIVAMGTVASQLRPIFRTPVIRRQQCGAKESKPDRTFRIRNSLMGEQP